MPTVSPAATEVDAARRSCARLPPRRDSIRRLRRRAARRLGSPRPDRGRETPLEQPVADHVDARGGERRSRSPARARSPGSRRAACGCPTSIRPQSAVPGPTPRPRNESAASETSANAKARKAFAIATGSTFGQMWPNMIRRSRAARASARPRRRAALRCSSVAAADEPRVDGREEDHEQRHREQVAAAEHADDDDRDEQRGQREDEVGDAHDRRVDAPAAVAGQEPEDVADQHRAERDDQRADDGRARPRDRAREDVAAEVVGAERMRRGSARSASRAGSAPTGRAGRSPPPTIAQTRRRRARRTRATRSTDGAAPAGARRDGLRSAASSATTPLMRATASKRDPRIDREVDEVGDQVDRRRPTNAISIASPWTTGMSLLLIASTSSEPTPGQRECRSRREPPRRSGTRGSARSR